MKPIRAISVLAVVLALAHPAAAQHEHPGGAPAAPQKPVLYDNLGSYHRAVTTRSPEAQRYFDQGLRLLYAFNLEEAQHSFDEAARLDPSCAMCFWGAAMSLGPHINMAGQPDRTTAAYAAVRKAAAQSKKASPVERALIAALARRYSNPPPSDAAGWQGLNTAYANAMRDVARRFPDDLDAATLYAEAMMNLRPWDLWSMDGKPQPGTEEILATLERVLAKNPNHPGANHYYIHAVEASPHPERALAAAERMGSLEPGAAHLVHMPSHIYARVGRWEDASEANRKAIAVDRGYLPTAGSLSFYFMYVAHNYQFLWSTSMMQGRSAESLANARLVVTQSPVEMLRAMPGFDFVLEYPIWTLVKFGRWEEAIAEPAPPADFLYATAVWHAARGLGFSGLGRLDEAEKELAATRQIDSALPADAMAAFNSAHSLLSIAENMLAGEIAARKGDMDEAVRRLREATKAEDGLRYDEPPDWYMPVRHALGAALLAANRPAEAEAVFEEDLRRHPENGWSLHGLAESLRRQKKDAAAVEQRFAAAWKNADYKLPSR
jgi:tetratricopeptide (TPR) repeat protein